MSTMIALVQMNSTYDKKANIKQATELIYQAKSHGVKMVFLPESFDFVSESSEQTQISSEPLNGDIITYYCNLASKENLWISLGGAHIKNDKGLIENTHIIINPEGTILETYAKVHLYESFFDGTLEKCGISNCDSQPSLNEQIVMRPGRNLPPVLKNTPIGNLGLAICYDVRFPELASRLRYKENAHVLLYPSAFTKITGDAGHWHTLLRARAIENQCYVIAAAQDGKHNSKRYSYGHSLVVDPWGQIVAERTDPGPGLLICEINAGDSENSVDCVPSRLTCVRQTWPIESHRRLDLFPMSDSGAPIPIGTQDYTFGPNRIKASCVFYRSKLSFAFVNLSPLVPGHVLVSPVKCLPRFNDLNVAEIADLYITVRYITSRLLDHFNATSLTVSIQDGIDAGQTVPHVHVHVLPRKPNDFARNDDIYQALQEHDKVANRVYRTEQVMAEEAAILRNLYYTSSN